MRYQIIERAGLFYPQHRGWFWWEHLGDRGTVMAFPSLAAARKHIEAEVAADAARRLSVRVHAA